MLHSVVWSSPFGLFGLPVEHILGQAHILHMHIEIRGVVCGSTVTLDEPVRPPDGQRVRVRLDLLEPTELELTAAEQSQLLREWAERGPQGPLDADDTWPDEN